MRARCRTREDVTHLGLHRPTVLLGLRGEPLLHRIIESSDDDGRHGEHLLVLISRMISAWPNWYQGQSILRSRRTQPQKIGSPWRSPDARSHHRQPAQQESGTRLHLPAPRRRFLLTPGLLRTAA